MILIRGESTFWRSKFGEACLHIRHHHGHLLHLALEGRDGSLGLCLVLLKTTADGSRIALSALTNSFLRVLGVRCRS
jgi:hypothetical protein